MKRIKELLKDKTIVGLLIAFIIVILILVVLIFSRLDFNHEVEIIDFSKLKETEIVEWFNKEFESDENLKISREYSEDVVENAVISQSVKAGEIIDKNTIVEVVLSKGIDPNLKIKLPNFVEEKYTKEKIEKYFADNKFTDVSYEYVISDEPKDTVIDINVNGEVKRSSLILVTLSVGDDPTLFETTVPDFSTYTVANAKAWGSSNAITIKVNYVFSDKYEEGKIISQSIKANETINGGSVITLQVSSGKGIEVKDLAGLTFKDADKWSDDVGVYIDPIYIYHDKVEKDKVIYTDPKPGTILKKGAVVDVYISKGMDPNNITVKVESKKNVSEADFLNYINGLGLKAQKSTSYYDDSVTKGNIISHTTGDIKMAQKVEYNLSLGPYSINVSDFEGKSKGSGDQVINSANALKAGISLSISAEEYNDSYSANTLYSCSVSGKTVSCKLSKGALKTVENYTGQNIQSDFSSNGVKYKVVFDSSFTEGTNYGDIYGQSIEGGQRVEDGTVVELYARRGTEPKAGIVPPQMLQKESYQQTYNFVKEKLGQFQDLTIIADENSDYKEGVIVSMTVNGSTQFESGQYPIYSTKIVIVISSWTGN